MDNLTVGIAEYKIVKAPNTITTFGLGSCCGVVLYDEINKVAGLVHILLSDSKTETNLKNKAKYADTGIVELYQEMGKYGANRRFIKAKLAGGAHMFNFGKSTSSIFSVGERNVKACKETLNKLKVKTIGKGEKFI